MVIHKSALKRARQNIKRNLRNRGVRSSFRTAIKAFNTALASKDFESAEKNLPELHKTIDRAVTKGIIHKNQANRRKSRLTLALQKSRAA